MAFSALEHFVVEGRRLRLSGADTAQSRQLVADEVPEDCYSADWVAAHSLGARFPSLAGSHNQVEYDALQGQFELPHEGRALGLTIDALGGQGRRAFVYRLLADSGETFALKVVREVNRENLYAIQVEPGRLQYLAELGLGAPAVLDAGSDYLLKAWVPGEVGESLRSALSEQHVDALLAFISRCIEHKLKIWDLKPRNLVYSDDQWVCIDPGRLSVGESKRYLIRYYKNYILSHWFKMKPISMRYAALKARLMFRRPL